MSQFKSEILPLRILMASINPFESSGIDIGIFNKPSGVVFIASQLNNNDRIDLCFAPWRKLVDYQLRVVYTNSWFHFFWITLIHYVQRNQQHRLLVLWLMTFSFQASCLVGFFFFWCLFYFSSQQQNQRKKTNKKTDWSADFHFLFFILFFTLNSTPGAVLGGCAWYRFMQFILFHLAVVVLSKQFDAHI